MNYQELSEKAHANAVAHGFWNEQNSAEHYLMLIVTEISKMVEADRHARHADQSLYEIAKVEDKTKAFELHIKDTVEDEMADIAIRLADLAGNLQINFSKLNPCRYYRAFNRFTFTENAFALVKGLSRGNIVLEKRIQFGLEFVESFSRSLCIPIDWHIREKMNYNETRPAKHGKAY